MVENEPAVLSLANLWYPVLTISTAFKLTVSGVSTMRNCAAVSTLRWVVLNPIEEIKIVCPGFNSILKFPSISVTVAFFVSFTTIVTPSKGLPDVSVTFP